MLIFLLIVAVIDMVLVFRPSMKTTSYELSVGNEQNFLQSQDTVTTVSRIWTCGQNHKKGNIDGTNLEKIFVANLATVKAGY